MELQEMMAFLEQLEANNTLEWMHAHKHVYQKARGTFIALLALLRDRLAAFDPEMQGIDVARLVMRLNRDTRFSKDKSPYQPAFRAHLSPWGGAPVPVKYFLQLRPGASFLGGGLFASAIPEATTRIRDKIASESERFSQIVHDAKFPFFVQGEALKRVPRDYDAGHLHAEYLKLKSFYLEDPVPDTCFSSADAFVDYAAARLRLMQPFHIFLNEALAGFTLPERPR